MHAAICAAISLKTKISRGESNSAADRPCCTCRPSTGRCRSRRSNRVSSGGQRPSAVRTAEGGCPPPERRTANVYTCAVPGPARHNLLTVLGLTFGLAVIVGNTIGAGILRTPGDIAAELPTFWPFLSVWIIGGLYALLGANALAELGTLMPKSGGQYVFVRHALGDYAGFITGWIDWISTCGTTAAVSIVLGEDALVLMPGLRAVEVIALGVVAVLTLVQWFGVRWGGWTQDLTSLLKALAFFFLIAACFYFGARHPMAHVMEVNREGSAILAFILALQAVIYTYDGWNAVVYFSEEVKDPGRNIPRAMFGGLFCVIAIYLLINVAFLRVVPL